MNKRVVMIGCLLLVTGLVILCEVGCKAVPPISKKQIQVIYNLDDSVYSGGVLGALSQSGVDSFAKTHAAAGVTDMFINVNAQRVNYRSAVWEAYWDGPNDNNSKQFRTFEDQGLDYVKLMIDNSRRHKMKAWLSVRMNDAHEPQNPDSPYHSTFWRSHPEYYLEPNNCLDYGQPEVREFYMKLIRELCTRYDMDGLELDYLRFNEYFRPGREHEGVKLMTAFVKEVRQLTNQASKRLGHPVRLAVRVPTTPQIARAYQGLDVINWAKAGYVDLVVVSCGWASTDTDVPIEAWKGLLLGTKTTVAYGVEDGINGDGDFRRTMTIDEMRGAFLSAISRGADGVYFFNLYGGPFTVWPREDYFRIMKESGDWNALVSNERRHPIARHSVWAPGEPGVQNILRYTGTQGEYRIHIGPKPRPNQSVWVELSTRGSVAPTGVKVNGILCEWSHMDNSEHVKMLSYEVEQKPDFYTSKRFVYKVPLDAVSDGYNLVEVNSDKPITTTWLEIRVK